MIEQLAALRSMALTIAVAATLYVAPASAAVHCSITNYDVTSYAHTGTYLAGTVGGNYVSFLIICGTQDCVGPATDRNLAVALTARALNQPLSLYFDTPNSCSSVTNYTQVTGLTLQP